MSLPTRLRGVPSAHGRGMASKQTSHPRWKRVLFNTTAALLVLAFLEGVLGLLSLASDRVSELLAAPWQWTVPDKRLGFRPNPDFLGHDDNGFRNPVALTRVDIVALGDSQTYGIGVASEQAYPKQLASLTDTTVYNMAYSGWGPVHSLELWDEAVALAPQIVIAGFYSGNDLFDAFNLVYEQGTRQDLKTRDRETQSAVENAEAQESLKGTINRLFNPGAAAASPADASEDDPSIRRLLSSYSNLYGLLRRVRYEVTRPADTVATTWEDAKAYALERSAYTEVYEDETFNTVFTPVYRLMALDQTDPRIREGKELSLRAFAAMRKLATDGNIRFIVVLLPTKELVFAPHSSNLSHRLRVLTQTEQDFWDEAKQALEAQSVEYVDTLPALRALLDQGIQPYDITHDGHPNEHGHRAIAELLASRLSSGL